jgi:hypothetical protein
MKFTEKPSAIVQLVSNISGKLCCRFWYGISVLYNVIAGMSWTWLMLLLLIALLSILCFVAVAAVE